MESPRPPRHLDRGAGDDLRRAALGPRSSRRSTASTRTTAPSSRRRRSSRWRRSGAAGLDCSPRGDAPGFVRGAGREDAAGARPARQQPHRYAAQHPARPARRAPVPDSRLRRDHPGHRPRLDLDRSGAGAELSRRGQGAAHRAGGRGRAGPTSAPRRSCARSCGMPRVTSSARACRAPARSSPTSRKAGSAAGARPHRA